MQLDTYFGIHTRTYRHLTGANVSPVPLSIVHHLFRIAGKDSSAAARVGMDGTARTFLRPVVIIVPMKNKLRHLLPAALLAIVSSASGQSNYAFSLPTMEGSPLSSWAAFTFPNTPPTTGDGSLSFQWRACWQAAFGGSSKIWIELKTGTGSYTQVYFEDGNTAECAALSRTAILPANVLSMALNVGNGSLIGRLKIQDACYPGVGCSFYNDPQVLNLTLVYTVHAAYFNAGEANICPGGTVQFTDASLNTPSSYAWFFPGGQPASSTSQNPTVQYASAGSYDVSLVVETMDGPDTLILPGFVTVYEPPLANAGVDEDLCAGENAQLQASGGVAYQWFPATGLNDPAIAAPLASPDQSTSYTVLVTDAHGCTANDNMVLTVHALPTVATSAGNNTVCLGDTVYVVAVGAQLYQWSPNLFISSISGAAVQVWPTSTFTWTVTGTDAFGCVNDSSFTLSVEPPPPAPVVTSDGMQVQSTTANSYQWYLNGTPIPGATAQSWAPLVNGNYSMEIANSSGCTSMSLPVYFGNVGMAGIRGTGLRTYPQPVHEVLVLEGLPVRAYARMINVQGATVLEGTVQAEHDRLDLSGLATGSYTLELKVAGQVQRIVVIKE